MIWTIVATVLAVAAAHYAHRWRRSRRRRPMTLDHCRACDRQLPVGRVYEVREHHRPVAGEPNFGGGTFSAVCYCRRHAPKGAVRA